MCCNYIFLNPWVSLGILSYISFCTYACILSLDLKQIFPILEPLAIQILPTWACSRRFLFQGLLQMFPLLGPVADTVFLGSVTYAVYTRASWSCFLCLGLLQMFPMFGPVADVSNVWASCKCFLCLACCRCFLCEGQPQIMPMCLHVAEVAYCI